MANDEMTRQLAEWAIRGMDLKLQEPYRPAGNINLQTSISLSPQTKAVGVAIIGNWHPPEVGLAEFGRALLYAEFAWRQFTSFGPRHPAYGAVYEAIGRFTDTLDPPVPVAEGLLQPGNPSGWTLAEFDPSQVKFIAHMTYANGGANFQLDLKNMPMGRGAAVFAPIAVSHFLAWLVLERRDAEGVISRLLGTAATIANYSRIGDRYVKGTVRFLIPIAATATEFKPSEEQTSPSAS